MAKHPDTDPMFYCKKCGSIVAGTHGDLNYRCQCCDSVMIESDISLGEYRAKAYTANKYGSIYQQAEFDRAHVNDLKYQNWFFDTYVLPHGEFDPTLDNSIFELESLGRIEAGTWDAKVGQKIRNLNAFSAPKNIPKCPICSSTDLQRISGAKKVGAAAVFGLFSAGYVSKTFKCRSCGATF